jgi:hypothetical protein
MGNQVVFSVSYDHLDVLEDQDFGSLASQIHESPYVPRFYTGDKPTRMLPESKGVPGIAFSHYSHASDGVVVAVSSQGITQPSMAFALKNDELNGGRLEILKGLKRTSKFMLNEPFSVRKSKEPVTRQADAPHERCEVFGYLTDNSHELHEDPKLMAKIAAHMRDPESNRLPGKINKVASLERGDLVLVKMHGNCFYASEKLTAGNGLTHEKWISENSFDERGLMAPREVEVWCSKQLLEGLGYGLKPLKEKDAEKGCNDDLEPRQ